MIYVLLFLIVFVVCQVVPILVSTLKHFGDLAVLLFFSESIIFCIPQISIYLILKIKKLKKDKKLTCKSKIYIIL